MKRLVALLSITCLCLLAGAQSASAQTAVTINTTGCVPITNAGVFTIITGTITPVPQTEYDISVVSNVRGEVFHITLSAGFDISGASVSVGPAPLGQLTATVFQDLDQDDVLDPAEPVLGSASVHSPCHPGPTHAEECSNGGWQSFGFASQGDCVAFVRTGGANEPGHGNGPPDRTPNSVTGSGNSSFCGGIFEVNAQSGPQGENPSGQVTCGTFFAGPVTCLNVTDNVALLNIQTSSFGTVALRITDNGTTGDRVEAIPGSGCAAPQTGYVDFGFSGGDITVSG
jgi:hypothetical protein